jgi:hypothetical protein
MGINVTSDGNHFILHGGVAISRTMLQLKVLF